MRPLLFILSIVMLLLSCSEDNSSNEGKNKTLDRAVLVYMAADNDLAPYAIDPYLRGDDVGEMILGSKSLNKKQKLLVFVDKIYQRPFMLEVENGDTTRIVTFKEELNSADPATLQMAVQTMMKRYRANSYGLVLWGHADGWVIKSDTAKSKAPLEGRSRRSYGRDATSMNTWMNISSMARALSALPKLDFIFADCCSFQTVEAAYELRHVTDYIIGSPAEIPGEGAPYNTVIPALFSTADNYWQLATDAYYNQITYDGEKEPLSVIKTSELEQLASATRQALASFVPQMDNPTLPDVSNLIYYYAHSMFDMNDFMLHHAPEEVYNEWLTAFNQTVIYKTFAKKWRANWVSFNDFKGITEQRYGGLSMYVPQNATNITNYNWQSMIKLQASTIALTQWYEAAGLKDVGW